jgi:membrane glycosyltransferase
MKELPPNPTPYSPPPEQWYLTYEYSGDPSASAMNQAIIAMMLTLHDTMGLKMRQDKTFVTPTHRNAFKAFAERHGNGAMDEWRDLCSALRVRPDDADINALFFNLIAER